MTEVPDTIIVMMIYNNAEDLQKCLDSLVAQTYQNFHLLVVDDASTDRSYEILLSYKEIFRHYTCVRNQKNLGFIGNFKKILTLSEEILPDAQYLLWGNGDDWWAPSFLEKTRHELIIKPESIVCYTWFEQHFVKDGSISTHELRDLKGALLRDACQVFTKYVTSTGPSYYNNCVHGLMRFGEMRTLYPDRFSVLQRLISTEISILAIMLLRGDITIVPQTLAYRKDRGAFSARNPNDGLSQYNRNVLKRSWAAFSHLPRFLRVRRPDRPIYMVVLMWALLLYVYAFMNSYFRTKDMLRSSRNNKIY